jgi:tetrahydromethanopterin S-methyltransferase subunit C
MKKKLIIALILSIIIGLIIFFVTNKEVNLKPIIEAIYSPIKEWLFNVH